MSTGSIATFVATFSVLAAAVLFAPTEPAFANDRVNYGDLLRTQGEDTVVRPILAAYKSPTADAEIKQLGAVLSGSPDAAAGVLDALAREKSVEAASVSAELLYAVTARVGGSQLVGDDRWGDFLENGVALLEHDDPFARGIAAWALVVVRDADHDAEGESDVPEWMKKCLALKPETSVQCDFVLQAFSQGVHRTTEHLSASAAEMLKRAEAMDSHARSCNWEQGQQAFSEALERFNKTYQRGVDRQPTTNLAQQRKWWLDVRRAVRDLVLAGPGMAFRQVVFFKTHVKTEGNYPDGLVQNHGRPKERRPGGDVFVQSGFDPADPTRPLIAGKLGPGHVQDMDLWWDADRLVFAYVRQPHWGDVRNSWGRVAWRQGSRDAGFDHVVGFREGVFWENGSEPTHLYEIAIDGTGLRQLTNDKLHCDREPAYLPNGDVVFSSDRGCAASQCGAAPLAYSDFGLPNLFRVSADGVSVERLTYNKDVDRYPHCLSNGLIGYMRWDYQERFWQWPHAIWTIRPDGTMNDGLFKVHFKTPQSVREPRSIPGSQKLVVIATGHHAPAEGAVAVVDSSHGPNDPAGLRYVTPSISPVEGGLGSCKPVAEGGVPDRGGLYKSPWPLSEKAFLVAYAHHHPKRMAYAAYYIDVWGNKELIHRDATMDVLCPMAVRKRPKPPAPSSIADPEADHAVCYLADVNRDMAGVEPGAVRYLRISERLQWFFDKSNNTGAIRWTPGTQHSRNFGYWTWSPTRVIGTVPVEEDGSAYFKVPAGLAVYFQALDENMMEIRRMRSHIEFKPGEKRSCVGCHETKEYTPRSGSTPVRLALRREPSLPKPPPWGNTEIVGYEELIQPIMNKHCVECHDGKNAKTDLDLTDSRDPYGFVQSYRSLFGISKDMPTPLGEGYREAYADIPVLQRNEGRSYETLRKQIYGGEGLLSLSNHMSGPEVTHPKQFGSHRSRLVLSLLEDEVHKNNVSLSDDEWEALVTWVDANAPYSSTYFQYFTPEGKLLPKPRRVKIKLAPPFSRGEKAYRIVGN